MVVGFALTPGLTVKIESRFLFVCNCTKLELIESDPQPLFCVFYCIKHDLHLDGLGHKVELDLVEVLN